MTDREVLDFGIGHRVGKEFEAWTTTVRAAQRLAIASELLLVHLIAVVHMLQVMRS